MPAQATYDDANLLLRLYDLRREEKMRAARAWFASSFHAASMQESMQKYPPGSDENTYYRMVTSYWDMVASFVTSGVLNQQFFFQSNRELLLVWLKVQHLLPEVRAAFKDPSALRNLETVGKQYADYLRQQGPEAYETFAARVAGMRR